MVVVFLPFFYQRYCVQSMKLYRIHAIKHTNTLPVFSDKAEDANVQLSVSRTLGLHPNCNIY